MKNKETLEEFAERLCPNKQVEYDMILEGAKFQQEQDKKLYSEEEVLKYVDYYEECYAERPTKKPLKPNEWFEQFKKK